jgi:hypothetical protein
MKASSIAPSDSTSLALAPAPITSADSGSAPNHPAYGS